MNEYERAVAFAESIACYGYPHSGAIEQYDAKFVKKVSVGPSTIETWAIGRHQIDLTPAGITLRKPLDGLAGTGRVR